MRAIQRDITPMLKAAYCVTFTATPTYAPCSHVGAGNRCGLQHPPAPYRPHQGHALRPLNPGPDRRRHRRPRCLLTPAPTSFGVYAEEALFPKRHRPNLAGTLDTPEQCSRSHLLYTCSSACRWACLLFLTGRGRLFSSRKWFTRRLSLVVTFCVGALSDLLIVMNSLHGVIAGTSLGVAGAIPPLVIAPPRLRKAVETACVKVDRGIIEATQARRRHTPADRTSALCPKQCGHHRRVTVTVRYACVPYRHVPLESAARARDLAGAYATSATSRMSWSLPLVLLLNTGQVLQSIATGWLGGGGGAFFTQVKETFIPRKKAGHRFPRKPA